jgi:hypothetical protein
MISALTRLAVWITDRQFTNDLKRMEETTPMTYKLMKRIIETGLKKGNLDVEATMLKLDVFLMADRITPEEYQELVELMNGGAE